MNDSIVRATGSKHRSWSRAAILLTALTLIGGGTATLLFSPLATVSAQSESQTFYVTKSTTATGGTGAIGSPLSWYEAIARAGAGDTIIFLPGIYTKADLGTLPPNGDPLRPDYQAMLEIKNKNGITVRAQNRATTQTTGRTVLKPNAHNLWKIIKVDGSQWITIANFEIDGSESSGEAAPWAHGVTINGDAPSYHIAVKDNLVHDVDASGITTGSGGDYITIEGNTVYNNCFWSKYEDSGISLHGNKKLNDAAGFHTRILRNRIYDNVAGYALPSAANHNIYTDSNGIIVDTQGKENPATLIENNVVYNNGGRGIHVFKSSNVVIRNNTCYKNCQDPYTRDGELSAVFASNVSFINNIAVANGLVAYGKTSAGVTYQKTYTDAGGTHPVYTPTNNVNNPSEYSVVTNTFAPNDGSSIKFAYNLYFGGPAATYGTYDTYGDPKFQGAGTTSGGIGNKTFLLDAGSLGRDSGTLSGLPSWMGAAVTGTDPYATVDISYRPRPKPTTVIDRGATEQ